MLWIKNISRISFPPVCGTLAELGCLVYFLVYRTLALLTLNGFGILDTLAGVCMLL